jgi:hypothetical protein
MRRRDFLLASAASTPFLGVAGAQDAATRAKLERVSVMSNDFDTLMTEVRDWSHEATPKQLDIMDFPEMMADRYHIHHVDVLNINFLSMEPSYCRKFSGRLKKAKSKIANMPVELDEKGYAGIVSACSPDPALRAKAIDLTKKWIDIASMMACPSIMVNQGTRALPEDLAPCVDALRTLSAYGKSKKVAVIMENRGRTPPEELAQLIRASGTYANPDIGNFPDEDARARGLRLLYPLSYNVSHVKMSPRFDFANAIRISKQMGFRGVYSIETGGPDPYAKVQTILDALLANM